MTCPRCKAAKIASFKLLTGGFGESFWIQCKNCGKVEMSKKDWEKLEEKENGSSDFRNVGFDRNNVDGNEAS